MNPSPNVKPVPDGYHTVTPYLIVADVARLLTFAREALDAKLIHQMLRPDGSAGHTEMQIGDSRIMLADATPKFPAQPFMLYLYLDRVDEVFERALAAGGTVIQSPTNMFYGDRAGAVADPLGNQWWLSSHLEDVPPDELQRRAAAAQGKP
jgi:uncharacterized glyoxalase superfamily protein PhnB